jgi:hypothetical protein
VSQDFLLPFFSFFHELSSPELLKIGSFRTFFAKIRKLRCTTCFNNTGGKFSADVNFTSGISTTPEANFSAGTAGVVDTGGKLWEQYQTAVTLK